MGKMVILFCMGLLLEYGSFFIIVEAEVHEANSVKLIICGNLNSPKSSDVLVRVWSTKGA